MPTYGFVLVVAHRDREFGRLGDIREAIKERNERLSWRLLPLVVDARPKVSASKL